MTAGVYVFADSPGSTNTQVQDNSITGPGTGAKSVAGLVVGTWYAHLVYSTTFGYGSVTVTATGNTIDGWHIDAVGAGKSFAPHLHHNDLLGGSGAIGVDNASSTKSGTTAVKTLDATDNFWGCTNGPGASGCTTVSGSVDYRPWLTATSAPRSSSPTANYWLVGSDGGIFSFGSARFYGSVPNDHIHVSNIVGIAAVPGGGGYWLVGSDGGIFSFGSARFYGSVPGDGIHVTDAVGSAATTGGGGYWVVSANGSIFSFGSATDAGSPPSEGDHVSDIAGMAAFG